MSRLYKRGAVWWCWYYDANRRQIRCSTRCTDRRAAERTLARLEREAADPSARAARERTLAQALERLVIDRRERGRADGTIEMYAVKAGQLLHVLGEHTPLVAIDAAQVDHYVTTRAAQVSRSTIGKELTTLRAALKLARRRGEYPHDVAAVMPIGWTVEYRPRRRVLHSGEELERLIAELPEHRGAHVAFLVATAARDSEAARAEREDIDLEAGTVRIRGTKTELADDRIAIAGFMRPLLEHVLATLADRPRRLFVPWTNARRDLVVAASRASAKARRQAEEARALGRHREAQRAELIADRLAEPLSPNDLRRTHATWLRALGIDLGLVSRQLRHVDTRMVSRVYGRLPASTVGASLRASLGECDDSVMAPSGRDALRGHHGRENPTNLVPRDGIEPPTRGFSSLRKLCAAPGETRKRYGAA